MKKGRRVSRRMADQLSAEAISTAENCTVAFEIYEDFQHIKLNTDTPILGSIGEFCGAFYHVPGNTQCCLDASSCKVAKMVRESNKQCPHWTPPKSVVALVKYEMRNDGNDIIVRYSNHYIQDATKHAEKFFSDDINQPRNEALGNSISEENLRKITMYITFQPCHLSTRNTPKTSCCDELLGLLNDPQMEGVEMCIKPTHIYIAGNTGPALELVERGNQGIMTLIHSDRINITGMENDDWNFLLNLVAMNDAQRGSIPPYSGSRREALDEEIRKFLRDVERRE